jgi:hypothetical protein
MNNAYLIDEPRIFFSLLACSWSRPLANILEGYWRPYVKSIRGNQWALSTLWKICWKVDESTVYSKEMRIFRKLFGFSNESPWHYLAVLRSLSQNIWTGAGAGVKIWSYGSGSHYSILIHNSYWIWSGKWPKSVSFQKCIKNYFVI